MKVIVLCGVSALILQNVLVMARPAVIDDLDLVIHQPDFEKLNDSAYTAFINDPVIQAGFKKINASAYTALKHDLVTQADFKKLNDSTHSGSRPGSIDGPVIHDDFEKLNDSEAHPDEVMDDPVTQPDIEKLNDSNTHPGFMYDPIIHADFEKLNDSIKKLEVLSEQLEDMQITMLDAEEMSCIVLTDIDRNVVMQAKEDQAVPADDPKYKKFLSCCWKQYGYQNDDGEINWNRIDVALRKLYPLKIVEEVITKCKLIKAETLDDSVPLVLQCLDEHVPVARNNLTE